MVWVIALVLIELGLKANHGGQTPLWILFLYLIVTAAAVLMFVMWIVALVTLTGQHAWGWFVGVLVSQLIFLGIIGMAAYALAGPEDTDDIVTRPTTT
jgi:hypothetical protein